MMQGKGLLLADQAVAMAQGQPPEPDPIPEPTPPMPPAEEREGCSPLARLFGRRAD
jgi:hypothetical protein